jgi:hypothetical protein
MFTYQHIREEIKNKAVESSIACMLPCTIEWISQKLKDLPPGSRMVEFGTFVSGTITRIANVNPDVEIHSIDLNNFDEWPEDHHMIEVIRVSYDLPELKNSDILEIQKIHTEDHKNIFLYTGKTTSLNIDNIALALIDANHQEDDVLEELQYLWPRMLEDAYIFGDDANDPGVANAFLKFAKTKDIDVTFYSKCVRIQKQKPISNSNRNDHLDDTLLFTEIVQC